MKKLFDLRILSFAIVGALLVVVAVGCSTRPDETEELPISGNHSPGEIYMVTSDTSSAGYHYLEPEISPDLSRVIFTADWGAIPDPGNDDDIPPTIRQLVLSTNEPQEQPLISLTQANTMLLLVADYTDTIGSSVVVQRPANTRNKGNPSWIDDQHILYWMDTNRGSRLFQSEVSAGIIAGTEIVPNKIFREEDEDRSTNFQYWMHRSPALSPDGQWLLFSRFGYRDIDDLTTYTRQALWAVRMPQIGDFQVRDAIQVTAEAAVCDAPAWSPDGRTIVFHATTDIAAGSGVIYDDENWSQELFSVDFDTTGYAAGEMPLNRGLSRLTYSPPASGNPTLVRNEKPCFSPDGGTIAFVSDRRAPTITLYERSIWSIPFDGSLEPEILFFSRFDDVDVSYVPGFSNTLVFSSAMGFPTEMLDRLYEEALVRIKTENPTFSDAWIIERAQEERTALEFFERVMSHVFVFTPGVE